MLEFINHYLYFLDELKENLTKMKSLNINLSEKWISFDDMSNVISMWLTKYETIFNNSLKIEIVQNNNTFLKLEVNFCFI